jgi:cytosine/adenosine deaminase-related metal-dependent hydrolase/SAM-dependent methyltransferase
MASSLPTTCITAADGYRVWARSYDNEPNPMLSVEERFLGSLLPPANGLDVVDLGCGTGRWLNALKNDRPRSLLGVDSSPEMLEIAQRKLGSAAEFVNTDCAVITLPVASADLVLCNFLLSYIEEAQAFLRKVSTMLRDGGSVFLTDLHPETVSGLNWRRGVHVEHEFKEIRTFQRSIDEVVALCKSVDLSTDICLEPHFGEAERLIFEAAGKREYFQQIKHHAAIYILQLRPRRAHRLFVQREIARDSVSAIREARLAIGPQSSLVGDLKIVHSRIGSLRGENRTSRSENSSNSDLDLSGFMILPGLVNSHDHLEFALFPRLGKGGYKNFLEWAEDIYHPGDSPVFEHRQVPRDVRLWWGGIRNLLSGVTTVCHHNPYEAEVFENDFVVRVLRDYGWAHSLPMNAEFANKKRETPKGQPFLIHLAEGIDECSAEEIFVLHQAGALDEESVIIHGVALGEKGKALLRSSGAGLIWCPSSNVFLFGKTFSSREIQSFPRVALGSDSPLTGQGDLLDELRFAHEFTAMPAENLYRYVTHQPARLLRLRNGEGTLRAGAWADLIAVRDNGATPADTLAVLSYKDIELVLIGGKVQLASAEMLHRLPRSTRAGLQPLSVEGLVRWIRAPLDQLFEKTVANLPGEIRLGGKQVNIGT